MTKDKKNLTMPDDFSRELLTACLERRYNATSSAILPQHS